MRSAVWLVTAVLTAACASVSTPTLDDVLRRPEPVERLRQDLRALFTDTTAARVSWSVAVRSLTTGELLYSLNEHRLDAPGDYRRVNQLGPTSMAALEERLGADFRFTTLVEGTAPVDERGVLHGDLMVTGDGDPTLNEWFPARVTRLDMWAARLREGGLRRVTGRLIGDDRLFAGPEEPWSWADLIAGYGYRRGGLILNEGLVAITIAPGVRPGDPVTVSPSPAGSGLTLVNDAVTAAADTQPAIVLRRVPGSPVLSIRGTLAVDATPLTRLAPVDNLTVFYVTAFRDALVRHGIAVGPAADIDDVDPAPAPVATTLLVDRSPPLAEIMRTLERRSTAGRAMTALRTVAPQSNPALRDADAVRERLRAWGVRPTFLMPLLPTSLPPFDHVTPAAYEWLARFAEERTPARLDPDPPASDLYRRLADTDADRRVWARTGPKTANARAVSGYAVTLANEPLAFAFMVNNFRLPATQIDRVIDAALNRLVRFTRSRESVYTPTHRPAHADYFGYKICNPRETLL